MVDAKQVTGKHLIPYLRNVDVRWDRINTIDLPLIDIAPHEIERFTVRVGDLLVCEGRHLGRCAFWNGEVETCAFQKALHRLRPLNTDTDVPRFLFFCMCLAYARDAFNMNKVDNTIPHLTGEMLRAHRFAFPPIEEQRAIAAYLDSATEGIESTAVVAKTEIALLREYRTRLIADVVTGKLDVRAAAAGLPDEVDEAGPLVDADAVEEDDESVGGDALDAAPNEAEV
jgi:type I restriction enzyme S subunit